MRKLSAPCHHYTVLITNAQYRKKNICFMQTMKEKAKLVNDYYLLPLPFRNADVKLPNNKKQTLPKN